MWQLVNKTVDCINNIVFSLVEKISSKKFWEKGKTTQQCWAVAVWFQSCFSQKDEEEKFDNSEKFAEKQVR